MDRYDKLSKFGLRSPLELVPIVPVLGLEDVDVLHDSFVDKGYEGVIIREALSKYEHKRSLGLFKYKKFKDSEFKIVGVKQDKDGGAIFELVTDKGAIFASRPMGTNQYRLNLWERRVELIGLLVTVRYSTLLESNVPEFNRTLQGGTLRDYE
jgi:DNA ligase-1